MDCWIGASENLWHTPHFEFQIGLNYNDVDDDDDDDDDNDTARGFGITIQPQTSPVHSMQCTPFSIFKNRIKIKSMIGLNWSEEKQTGPELSAFLSGYITGEGGALHKGSVHAFHLAAPGSEL